MSDPCGLFVECVCAGREGPSIRPPEWIASTLEERLALFPVGRQDSHPVSPSAAQGVGSRGGNTRPGTA